MTLDKQTLLNLHIFHGSQDDAHHESPDTLFNFINKTKTSMGQRLLREWLSRPLSHAECINHRLDAVDWLKVHDAERKKIQRYLQKLPDLERLITRIHQYGKGEGRSGDEHTIYIYTYTLLLLLLHCDTIITG